MRVKLFVVLAVVVSFLGCSNSDNPVRFKNTKVGVNTEPTEQYSGDVKVNDLDLKEELDSQLKRPYTLLELYIEERITRDFMISWFFTDVTTFREKLFAIENEIEEMGELNQHDTDRILFLEEGLNNIIQKFNNRNIFKRSKEVVSAAIDVNKPESERKIYYNVDDVNRKGAPASAISDNTLGYLGSFVKYGFSIEYVNFLDR